MVALSAGGGGYSRQDRTAGLDTGLLVWRCWSGVDMMVVCWARFLVNCLGVHNVFPTARDEGYLFVSEGICEVLLFTLNLSGWIDT